MTRAGNAQTGTLDLSHQQELLTRLLRHCRDRDYAGYSKHDGLLSPLLNGLLGWHRVGRLIAIQSVMRFPWNIRRVVGIPQRRNPKGIGLFAYACLRQPQPPSGDEARQEAEALLDWLLGHTSGGQPGLAWGYHYPWQDLGFFAPAGMANRVVTCWIGQALHLAWQRTGSALYLDSCRRICSFLLDAPNRLVDTPQELCLSYVPDPRVTWAVMDVSALCGRMLALVGTATRDAGLLDDARRCLTYVANRQTDYGAWYYADPPRSSPIAHDNYHTGIILDCFLDYSEATGDDRFLRTYRSGLEYYAAKLFLANGAPRWMNSRTYPHDIHGAAQGIISFAKAARLFPDRLDISRRILSWTVANLLDPSVPTFWYQKGRWFTKRFTLMRWCNAWMAVALAELINAEVRGEG